MFQEVTYSINEGERKAVYYQKNVFKELAVSPLHIFFYCLCVVLAYICAISRNGKEKKEFLLVQTDLGK